MAKINGDLFNALEREITKTLAIRGYRSFKSVENFYVSNKIGKDHKKRARWDLFYATPHEFRFSFTGEVYYGLEGNDDHIDTALKRITGIR